MTSRKALNRVCDNSINNTNWQTGIKRKDAVKKLEKDIEILEIIKEYPELVWWCICYDTAEEMIADRKGFMISYSIKEIVNKFNKVKEWLKND